MCVPVEAAAVRGGGEDELRLAQGEAFRDPRPDIAHLLGTEDLRGEGVGVQGQLHVTPGVGGTGRREREKEGREKGERQKMGRKRERDGDGYKKRGREREREAMIILDLCILQVWYRRYGIDQCHCQEVVHFLLASQGVMQT